jgi:tetratricopeptide (TPR) repeat protein
VRIVRQARATTGQEGRVSAFAAAAAEFERALEADALFPGARTNLGYCFIEVGRHGDAKREIERAMKEFPRDGSALVNYAVILQYNRQSDEAERHLRRAISVDPAQGTAYRDLAFLLERRGRYRAAADNLERYLALEPHANDERPIRMRIKLLRDRAGFLELPDQVVTPVGVTANLKRRVLAAAVDGALLLPLWQLATWLVFTLSLVHTPRVLVFVWGVFFFHLATMELTGGTLGKMVMNVRVRDQRADAGFSPVALREALKLAPALISFLLPWPWNWVTIMLLVSASFFSALTHRAGRAWYDRLTGTDVVEWDYGWGRVASLVLTLGLLAGSLWLRLG